MKSKNLKIAALSLLFIGSTALLTSCKKKGCTDEYATNYDALAEKDDGTCLITDCLSPANDITPTNYAEITYCVVQNNEDLMSADTILAIDDLGNLLLNPGDVLIYKTNAGRFGKMQITDIDAADNYALTFKATTYALNGDVYKESAAVVIPGTYDCDLDEFIYGDDFWWERVDTYLTKLAPGENVAFVELEF